MVKVITANNIMFTHYSGIFSRMYDGAGDGKESF